MRYQHWEEVVTLTNYAVELKNVYKRFPLPTGGELEACKDINITLENDHEDAAYYGRRDLRRWRRDSAYEL